MVKRKRRKDKKKDKVRVESVLQNKENNDRERSRGREKERRRRRRSSRKAVTPKQIERTLGGFQPEKSHALISTSHFNYPGWHEDERIVNSALDRRDAHMMLTSMKRKQKLHDGKYEHEGIEKLHNGRYNYPSFEDDKNEAVELYLSGYDMSLKRALDGIEQRQRLHDGDRSDKAITELDSLTFTYDEWETDKQEVENTLDRKVASRLLVAMKRKQELHDGTCDHPGIIKLIKSTTYNYPGYEADKNEVLVLFSEGYVISLKKALDGIEHKQRIYDGDRSDKVLVELDSRTFTYPEWRFDKEKVELSIDRSEKMRCVLAMKRKQQLHDGRCDHSRINKLSSGMYSYPGFDKDQKEAMSLFTDGYTVSLNRLLDSIDQKQRAHEGDRTDYELVLVDVHAATFTYAGWHEDMRRVEKPVDKREAYKLLQRMYRKQEIHDGVYKHEGIRRLMTEDFDYPEFEEDREIAKTMFCRLHDVALERTLEGIFQKQRIFNDYKGNPSRADDDIDACALCMENAREYTFIPCGHMSLCEACAVSCLNDASMTRCMTCMNEYKDIIKIFG